MLRSAVDKLLGGRQKRAVKARLHQAKLRLVRALRSSATSSFGP